MRATLITQQTRDDVFLNVVAHCCSCGEFLRDIQREADKFREERCQNKPLSKIDIFWHLNEYCEKKYGPCHWQRVSIEAIVSTPSPPPEQ